MHWTSPSNNVVGHWQSVYTSTSNLVSPLRLWSSHLWGIDKVFILVQVILCPDCGHHVMATFYLGVWALMKTTVLKSLHTLCISGWIHYNCVQVLSTWGETINQQIRTLLPFCGCQVLSCVCVCAWESSSTVGHWGGWQGCTTLTLRTSALHQQ